MSNTIHRFDFELLGGKSAAVSPAVVIVVERWTGDGAPVISANLVTALEIDEHVAALKADLDDVSWRAKAALKNSN